MKFYKCKTCGKIVAVIKDSACGTVCCGIDMVELKPGTTDAFALADGETVVKAYAYCNLHSLWASN